MELQISSFTFGPFAENTYLVWDTATKECMIIDPGCYDAAEEHLLSQFIHEHQLQPVILFNTHCHIDHVMGNKFVSEKYQLPLTAHPLEKDMLQWATQSALLYGLKYQTSPDITQIVDTDHTFTLGDHTLSLLFTPGHAPGHLTLLHPEKKWAIVGDVIFKQSIGRTDLPGGDFDVLENSIKTMIYTLPDQTVLYNGHGPHTDVLSEKNANPFVRP
jgi:hydroxyacylglutathione hydrolase